MIYKNVELHNIEALIEGSPEEGLQLCRVPLDLRQHLNENAFARSLFTTGSEIRFNLPGDQAVITLATEDQPAIVEIYNGSFMASWHVVTTEPTSIVVAPPEQIASLRTIAAQRELAFDPDLYRVMLPWKPAIRLLGIEGDLTPPRREQTPAQRYLAYGSSITQGGNSIRPSGTYAMRTAQYLGVDLINLGFGGGAHLESEVADYIAGRNDWDFATLELGINLVNRDLPEDEFAARVDYFIDTISSAHPDKWIFCIDMFPFRGDFEPANQRPRNFRKIVRNAVEGFNRPKLIHINGQLMLPTIDGLTADALHPATQGMEQIAYHLSEVMKRHL